MNILKSFLTSIFFVLFFVTPMIMVPWTSELFEFNKMLTIYLLTGLMLITAGILCWYDSKFVIPPRIIRIPLLLFVTALGITTIFSVDVHTSLWGYYSRFHGGLMSTLAYTIISLIFFHHRSAHNSELHKKIITLGIISTTIIALYGIAQHFGIDDHLWKQDVKNRIFSSLGQPNWLAALLSLILPFTWYKLADTKSKIQNFYYTLSSISLFLALLYTRSRSGFLATIVSLLFFLFIMFLKKRVTFTSQPLIRLLLLYFLCAILSSTPFTPSAFDIKNQSKKPTPIENIPALEGGTDSGIIRKIVWQGAYDLGREHPIVGTGPETFAYTYYWTRPLAHNMVSEWDFLYNKAHNEYLNYFATTGVLGLGMYLLYITAIAYLVLINLKQNSSDHILTISIGASLVSILITNFFGFSVTVTDLWLYLLPMLFPSLPYSTISKQKTIKAGGVLGILGGLWLIYTISNIFRADVQYTKAKTLYNQNGNQAALQYIFKAESLSSSESLYYDLHSKIASDLAIEAYFTQKNTDLSVEYATQTIQNSNHAITLNPVNTNFLRSRASVLVTLASLNPAYYDFAIDALNEGEYLAPTDPKMPYNIAIIKERQEKNTEAIDYLKKAIQLKPNYTDALSALAQFQHQASFSEGDINNPQLHQEAINTLQIYLKYAPLDEEQQQVLATWEKEASAPAKLKQRNLH